MEKISDEIFQEIKTARLEKKLKTESITVPRITGKAASSLVSHFKFCEQVRAKAISRSSSRVIRC